jgi:hypothetical protein
MGGIFRFWGIVALGLAYGQVLSPDFRENLDELSNWQRQLSESIAPEGRSEREPWPLEAKSSSKDKSKGTRNKKNELKQVTPISVPQSLNKYQILISHSL